MTDRRRDVSVIDCTIRDGGCCNRWRFDKSLVQETFEALVAAGVDIMEIGYQSTPGLYDPATHGPWRFCNEADLKDVARASRMRLACMLDMGQIRAEDLRPARDSLVSVLRLATYAKDVDGALDVLTAAHELGYETYVNVMAVSTCTPQEVDVFLGKIRESVVQNVIVVDSFGAMYPHHIRYLVRKYKNWVRPDQRVGVHLHNNQETAFANTIAAIDEGAEVVDATIFGMGRGAGNCPLELLLMYLDDPSHDPRPILKLHERYATLREELKWGYHVPYAVTGWLNLHPKEAIARMREPRQDALEFYERLTKNRSFARHHVPVTDS